MAGLDNKTIASTFHSLLKVSTSDNQNLDSTVRDIVDGEDTISCLALTSKNASHKSQVTIDGDHSTGTVLNINNGYTSTDTGDPMIKFQLSGSNKVTAGIDDSDSDKFKIHYSDGFGTGIDGLNAISITSAGLVGIGTADPDKRLHVHQANACEVHIESTNNNSLLSIEAGSTSFDSIINFDCNGDASAAQILYSHHASPGTQEMQFKVGDAAVTAITIDGTGNVDFGVDGTGGDIKFYGDTSSSYMLWDESGDQLRIINATASAVPLYIETPLDYSLHVHSTNGGCGIKLSDSATTGGQNHVLHCAGDTLSLKINGNARFTCNASGTTFNDALTVGVDDTGHDVRFYGDTASRYWEWDTSADGVVQRGTLTVGVNDTGHDVKFYGATSGAYMLWDESEDRLELDIGTADGAAIRINTSNNRYKDIQWVDSGSVKSHIRFIDDTSGTDGLDRLVMGTATDLDVITIKGGSVGFGGGPQFSGTSTTDNYRIDVVANSALDAGVGHTGYAARFLNDGGNANRGGIRIVCGHDSGTGETIYLMATDGDGNQIGTLTNNSGGGSDFVITTTSDARLKENIVDTKIDGLDIVNKIKVREFDWIKEKGGVKNTAGFIAQEVQAIWPAAVSGTDGATMTKTAERPNEDGTYDTKTVIDPMSVADTAFISVMMKAIQQLSAKVTALENK
jgi:hypothetical protein